MDLDDKCGSCKFMKQGKNCCYCANPIQTNEDLTEYIYYNFGCDLHEKGKPQLERDETVFT